VNEKIRTTIQHLAKQFGYENSEKDSEDFAYLLFMSTDKTIIDIEKSHDEDGLGYDGYSALADHLENNSELGMAGPATPIGLNGRN
jgi:hypothetical protein